MQVLDACSPKELRFVHQQLVQRGSHGVDFLRMLPVELGQQILSHLDVRSLGRAQQASGGGGGGGGGDAALRARRGRAGADARRQAPLWRSVSEAAVVWEAMLRSLRRGWPDTPAGAPAGGPAGGEPPQLRRLGIADLRRECRALRAREHTWRCCRPIRRALFPHADKVTALRIRGGVMASGSYDRMCSVWDVASQRLLHMFETHTVSCIDLAPAHGVVATGSFNREIRIWQMETGECLQTLTQHVNAVLALCMDGDMVFSGGADCLLIAWDWRRGSLAGTFAGHHGKISAVCCARVCGELLLFSASFDGTLRCWSTRTFQCIASARFGQPVLCMDVGDGIIAAGTDQAVVLIAVKARVDATGGVAVDLGARRELQLETSFGRAVHHVALNGRFLAAFGRELTVWGLDPPVLHQRLIEGDGLSHGSLAMDSSCVVVGEADGHVVVFDFTPARGVSPV
ncbi:hypothetical protein HK105_204814 [Polyrhizophydium stewartii]|uniref:Uncharacterized protein n=1 Tax=Polyrhizophydium stewartii TaxID=2732419 RepID=A0ABR4N851_9FUNG